jgi:sugar phosphate isomerase/epimerase
MKLGFVSAIFPDLNLDDVLRFASEARFETVEVMCWPAGKADRRYAGVTHIDVTSAGEVDGVRGLLQKHKVSISALGYYPNPLCTNEKEAAVYINHLKQVISVASKLELDLVNTFVGRDHTRSVRDNWSLFNERWPSIVKHAESCEVRIGIEHCPMLYSEDEWPGGKNLPVSPKMWREMFERIPSRNFGLNYDPSHLVWQLIDPAKGLRDFAERIFHVHAKDVRVDREKLHDVGVLANPSAYHTPKLPGLGDVNWSQFFSALTDTGYTGPVCIEAEDRAFEPALSDRKRGLLQAKRFLENFVS